MAKLELTLDTETNDISIAVNGGGLADPHEVRVFNWGSAEKPEWHFEVYQHSYQDGIHTATRVMASRDDGRTPAQAAIASLWENRNP